MQTLNNFFKESENVQKSILDDMHNNQKLSLKDMADQLNTYPNRVRRLAMKLEVPLRDKSAAQSNALSTGKLKHPTEGRERTEAEKKKIGAKIYDYWDKLTDAEMEERAKISRDNWEKLTEDEKQEFWKKASQARLKTSKDGSKLERIIQTFLAQNYTVEVHRELMLLNNRFHIDILLPELKTAIEIDGPTHFKAIWGNKDLEKVKLADNNKDGLLLNAGFSIIRVQQRKNLTKKLVNQISNKLTETLSKIDVNKPSKFVIGEI